MPSLLSFVLSGGTLIDVDGSLLIQLGVFFALFFGLRHLVFRPMVALLDARETAIDGAKKEARMLEAGADEKLKAFEAEMKKVKIGAGADRDALRQDAARLERELLAKAREEADATLADATRTMQADAAKIRADMKTSVPLLASQLAEKLLGRKAA